MRRHLFEDNMEVKEVDKEGKRFDKVSRIEARTCESNDVRLILDYNSEIYDLPVGTKFTMVLTESLDLDSNEVGPGQTEFDQSGRSTLADEFEYVMHGKVFKMDFKGNSVEVFASFGGLLMSLQADEPQALSVFSLDAYLYLLIKRIGG